MVTEIKQLMPQGINSDVYIDWDGEGTNTTLTFKYGFLESLINNYSGQNDDKDSISNT